MKQEFIRARVDAETKRKLKKIASEMGVSLSDVIRFAVHTFLNREHNNHDWIKEIRKGAKR